MSKVAVLYWSGSGNTEAMANAVAEGAKAGGAETTAAEIDSFSADQADSYDAFALGCPAMGDEELEDSIFEPALAALEPKLVGKKVALFGSYGWGDGEWMRSWEERCREKGIALISEGLILNETPDSDGEEQCRALGGKLV